MLFGLSFFLYLIFNILIINTSNLKLLLSTSNSRSSNQILFLLKTSYCWSSWRCQSWNSKLSLFFNIFLLIMIVRNWWFNHISSSLFLLILLSRKQNWLSSNRRCSNSLRCLYWSLRSISTSHSYRSSHSRRNTIFSLVFFFWNFIC